MEGVRTGPIRWDDDEFWLRMAPPSHPFLVSIGIHEMVQCFGDDWEHRFKKTLTDQPETTIVWLVDGRYRVEMRWDKDDERCPANNFVMMTKCMMPDGHDGLHLAQTKETEVLGLPLIVTSFETWPRPDRIDAMPLNGIEPIWPGKQTPVYLRP